MRMQATVVHLDALTEHVIELHIKPDEPVSYQPGQWISLALPIGPRPPLKRVYSMAFPMDDDGILRLIFDRVPDGLGSSYLAQLEIGAELEIINCMGNFVMPEELPNQLLFVARYTGIVPVFAILKQLAMDGFDGRIHLVYSSPTRSEIFFLNEIEALGLPGLTVVLVNLDAMPGDLPEADVVATFAHQHTLEQVNAYLCGVGEMVRPLRKALIEMGFPRKQIKSERFS